MADAEVPRERIVAWFGELGRGDTAEAGGNGADLGGLTSAGLPVPPGFVVTAAGYRAAMDEGGVRHELRALFAEACGTADDPEALAVTSERLRALVRKAHVPARVAGGVLDAYHRLGAGTAVAVRSSATSEDTAGTSFAGMHETCVNVVGDAALLDRLVDCWASLYGERAISYRASRGLTEEPAIAVVVQEMVPSERAGVPFTVDPSTGDRSRILVEGAFGLGEVVVGGQVEPEHKIVGGEGGTVERVELSPEEATRRVPGDEEAVELARLGLAVEAHYRGGPQDVEWAVAGRRTYLVQARPITSLGPVAAPAAPAGPGPGAGRLLLRGLAASVGTASGRVRVLQSPRDSSRLLAGEVVVAPMTNPDGGEAFEPVEDNPMIGYRGCYRHVREPDLFALELELLARVREQTPNLHLMLMLGVDRDSERRLVLDAARAGRA